RIALPDDERTRSEDLAVVVALREPMNGDTGLAITRIDRPKIRIGSAVPRKQRRVRPDAAESRTLENARRDPSRPEQTHHEIGRFALDQGSDRVVEALSELTGANDPRGTDPAREASTSRPVRRWQHREPHVVPVASQEARGERQPEICDAKRQAPSLRPPLLFFLLLIDFVLRFVGGIFHLVAGLVCLLFDLLTRLVHFFASAFGGA